MNAALLCNKCLFTYNLKNNLVRLLYSIYIKTFSAVHCIQKQVGLLKLAFF